MPALPKPVLGSAKRAKAAGKRRQSRADRLVYAAVDKRDGHRCRVCLEYRGLDIQRHHIVYRSAGGPITTSNVVSLCATCHLVGVHGGRIKLAGNADEKITITVTTTWVGAAAMNAEQCLEMVRTCRGFSRSLSEEMRLQR